MNSICRINPQIFDRGIVSEEVYNQFYKEDIDYYMNQDGISRDELLNSSFVDDDFLNIRKSATYKVGTGVSFNLAATRKMQLSGYIVTTTLPLPV